MPSHCNPHLCSDQLKQLLLPCFSFRFTSYSTSNTMLSARSALTPSAATEHDNEPLLVKAAKALLAKATCQKAKRPRKSGNTYCLPLLQSTAASSTAWIPEAATDHSEIQRLLAKAACQEAKKRRRKSGKGTESKRPKKSGKGTRLHARKTSSDSPMSSDTETQVPTVLPSDDELPTPTDVPSNDQQALAPAPSPGG